MFEYMTLEIVGIGNNSSFVSAMVINGFGSSCQCQMAFKKNTTARPWIIGKLQKQPVPVKGGLVVSLWWLMEPGNEYVLNTYALFTCCRIDGHDV